MKRSMQGVGGCRVLMDIPSRFSVAGEASLAGSDSGLRNAIRGGQEELYFKFTGKNQGHEYAGCLDQGNVLSLLLLLCAAFNLSPCRQAFSASLVRVAGNLGTDCS